MRRAALAALVLAPLLTACDPGVVGAPGCPAFPADSHWHTKVTTLPALTRSAAMVAIVGASRRVHADFGSGTWDGGPIGIPFTTVAGTQPRVAVSFDYADESDPGPYPIPSDAPIEGGPSATGDRHVLVVDRDRCRLYELYDAHRTGPSTWHAGSGAVWDLRSNALRPNGWTSADAAGLPILPGLVTYDEVRSGTVAHAIRLTVPVSRKAAVWPARHQAGSTTAADAPPMGQRFRLRPGVNPAAFPASVRPIIVALQTYGGIVADNGSAWFLSGAPDARWNNDDLSTLGRLTGADFAAVDGTRLRVSDGSGQARIPS
ncbi:MAG: hypothetical protein JWM05_749 [Acidimicrobiales bacterium]|nr:hypothetical protein [Acidimicrobiales bacterium]